MDFNLDCEVCNSGQILNNFEVALVDHTGIDIIAYHKKTRRRLGISVKTRSKAEGAAPGLGVRGDEHDKIKKACEFFNLEEWICFVLDQQDGSIYLFLLSLDKLDKMYKNFKKGKDFSWAMGGDRIKEYEKDPNIFTFKYVSEGEASLDKWFKETAKK